MNPKRQSTIMVLPESITKTSFERRESIIGYSSRKPQYETVELISEKDQW